MMAAHERRAAKRYPLELRGYAIFNGDIVGLDTRDISLKGGLLLLDACHDLNVGTKLLIRLDMRLRGMVVICRLVAEGRHTLYGVRFDRFDSYSDLVLLAYLVRHEQKLSAEVVA